MKQTMSTVFVNLSALLAIGLITLLVAHIPEVGQYYLELGILAAAYGFEPLKRQIRKIPGVQ
jgi:hypothetical protein